MSVAQYCWAIGFMVVFSVRKDGLFIVCDLWQIAV